TEAILRGPAPRLISRCRTPSAPSPRWSSPPCSPPPPAPAPRPRPRRRRPPPPPPPPPRPAPPPPPGATPPRIASRVAPVRIGLALGGGAAKGFAHIGVIKMLEANGIHPDVVAGTNAGHR